jgi:hypothetical protein
VWWLSTTTLFFSQLPLVSPESHDPNHLNWFSGPRTMRSLPTEREADMWRVRPKQVVIFLGAVILCTVIYAMIGASSNLAQNSDTYKVRLTTVPVDPAMLVRIAGHGELKAVVSGNKLTITGTFAGLRSPATEAHIHRGLAKGVRGPAILDLEVTKAMSGSVSRLVSLSPERVDDLKNQRLYVQIDSQGAPDGNLWGWLLR